jgi:hypothetical protein
MHPFSKGTVQLFAAGGNSVPNEQGVHWYSTREDAVEALKRVYTFSFWAYDKKIRPPCHQSSHTELMYQG